MKNMRISMKLIISFLIVTVLTLSVGIVGIISMNSLNNATTEMYNSNILAMEAMAELRVQFNAERNDIRNLFLSQNDPAKIKSIVDGFAQYDETAAENFSKYEMTMEDASQETAYYTSKDAYLGQYAAMKKEMFSHVNAGRFDEAYEVFMNNSAVIAPIQSGFSEGAALNSQWADDANLAADALFHTSLIIFIIILAVAVVVSLFLAFYISGLISKPVTFMKNVLHMMGIEGVVDFSDEEYRQAEEYARAKDEVGESIKMLIRTGRRLESVGQALETVASGDLTAELALLSERDTIGRSLQKMLDNLNSMFGDIRTASDQVSSGAGQVSQGAQSLASGSSQQAASIEEFNAALTELQDKTNRNADNSAKAREANNLTGEKLSDSIRAMGGMVEAMSGIDESSQNITRVIKVIDDIAFQTNILALNAAVEAARAGQHGKGFAVVADEVRNLAAKSAEAAKETSALIEGSSERVKEGNQIVAKTSVALEAAAENARESTRLIEEVAAASIDQAKSIVEINQGMEQISTVVQANSATAEQSAAASEEMSAQAVVMNEIVAKFKLRQEYTGRSARAGTVNASGLHAQKDGQPDASGFALTGGKY